MISSVGDEVTGFNRKRMSTNGRAEEVFLEFDCKDKVIGVVPDVVVVVVEIVVVAVDVVGKTIKSVGGLI